MPFVLFLIAITFSMVACNVDGPGNNSPGAEKLVAPASLRAIVTLATHSKVDLSWTYPGKKAPAKFVIYRANSKSSVEKAAAQDGGKPYAFTTELKFLDTRVFAGNTYHYAVRGLNNQVYGPASPSVMAELKAEETETEIPPVLESTAALVPPIPAEWCGNKDAYHITEIFPPLGTILSPNEEISITARIDYSTTSADRLGLSVQTDVTRETPELKLEHVNAGCGSVTVTLANIDVGNASQVIVSPRGDNAYLSPFISYRVQGQPFLTINSADPAPSVVLSSGNVTGVTLNLSWDFQSDTFEPEVVTVTDVDFYFSPLSIATSSGNQTVWLPLPPAPCGKNEFMYVILDGNSGVLASISYLQTSSGFFINAFNTALSAAANGTTQAVDIEIENCGSQAQSVTATTDVAWISAPQTMPLDGYGFDIFTVDVAPSGLTVGTHTGNLTLWFNSSVTHIVPITLTTYDFSYSIAATTFAWITPPSTTSLFGAPVDDDDAMFAMPFTVEVLSVVYDSLTVTTNGVIKFGDFPGSECCGGTLPTDQFAVAIAPFWEDLYFDSGSSISYGIVGTTPSRKLVITYEQVPLLSDSSLTNDFQVVLFENSAQILVQYGTLLAAANAGFNVGDGVMGLTWQPGDNTAFLVTKD